MYRSKAAPFARDLLPFWLFVLSTRFVTPPPLLFCIEAHRRGRTDDLPLTKRVLFH